MNDTRINKVTIVIGERNAGKTDFTKNLIYPIPKKKIVVDTHDSENWRNYRTFKHSGRSTELIPIVPMNAMFNEQKSTVRVITSDPEQVFSFIALKAYNCLIVLEDATRFFDDGKVPKNVKTFILDTKQRNVDFILVFHSLSDVPPKLIRWSDYITLFKTIEVWSPAFNGKFPNQKIRAAFDRVKKLPQYSEFTVQIGA